jgi:hypothetical protein
VALSVPSFTEMTVSGAAGSHVLNKPGGTVSGDLLVAFHSMAPAGSLASMTPPAGWTESSAFSNAAGFVKGFTKFAGGSEPATYTFGGNAAAHSKITIVRVTGFTGTLSLSTQPFGSTGAGTSHLVGHNLIAFSNDAVLLCMWGGPVGGSANTWTATGFTFDGTAAQGAQQLSHIVAHQLRDVGGVGNIATGFATLGNLAASSLSFSGATGDNNLAMMITQPSVPVSAAGLFTELRVEIRFDGTNWVDVSDRVQPPGLAIRAGRATRFSDIAPALLSVTLTDHDGALMPDNADSPHFPNVVEGKHIRVTAIRDAFARARFYGFIRSIEPEFPTGDPSKAITKITAADALSQLATFKAPSSWVNSARYVGVNVGNRWDTFILTGDGDAAVYFNNPSDFAGTKARAKTVPAASRVGTMTFGAAEGLSIEGSAKFNPAQSGSGGVIRVDTSGNTIRSLVFWVKFPRTVQSASGNPVDVVRFRNAGDTATLGSLRLTLNVSQDDLAFFDSGGTFVAPAFGANVGTEKWTMVSLRTVTATPTTTQMIWHSDDTTSGGTATFTFDLRNVRFLYFGGLGADVADMEIAGISMWSNEASLIGNPQEGLTGGTPWTIDTRRVALGLVTPAFIGFFAGSDLTEPVVTGNWHGKTALQVANEIARSDAAAVFARPFPQDAVPTQSFVGVIGSNLLNQTGVIFSVDAEADLLQSLTLTRGVETRPTRITIDYPGGASTVVDVAAEAAAGEQRSQSVVTTLPDFTPAEALATTLLAKSALPIEISQMTVDLETCANNIAEDVLSLTFPGRRIRITNLPASHFGAAGTTRDVIIEGWTEYWDAVGGCRITYDLSAV